MGYACILSLAHGGNAKDLPDHRGWINLSQHQMKSYAGLLAGSRKPGAARAYGFQLVFAEPID